MGINASCQPEKFTFCGNRHLHIDHQDLKISGEKSPQSLGLVVGNDYSQSFRFKSSLYQF